VGGDYGGNPNGSTVFPGEVQVDYVRVYDYTTNTPAFRITAVAREGNDVRVTWVTGIGLTNALQTTAGAAGGGYQTNNFSDIFTVTNTADTTTNYLDLGGATNTPARYYRVRQVP